MEISNWKRIAAGLVALTGLGNATKTEAPPDISKPAAIIEHADKSSRQDVRAHKFAKSTLEEAGIVRPAEFEDEDDEDGENTDPDTEPISDDEAADSIVGDVANELKDSFGQLMDDDEYQKNFDELQSKSIQTQEDRDFQALADFKNSTSTYKINRETHSIGFFVPSLSEYTFSVEPLDPSENNTVVLSLRSDIQFKINGLEPYQVPAAAKELAAWLKYYYSQRDQLGKGVDISDDSQRDDFHKKVTELFSYVVDQVKNSFKKLFGESIEVSA